MIVPNLIVDVHAPPKTGKTHFMCTFPEPIVVFSFDLGIEPVLQKFKGKDIEVKEYPIPIQMTSKPKPYAKEIWDVFLAEYLEVIEVGKAKTLGIDTGTALYEICRIARSEELGRSIVPYEYAEVYARMTGVILKPRLAGMNLVITHWMRDEYLDDKKTGRIELDGFRRIVDYVDVSLSMKRQRKGNVVSVATTIEDNRYVMNLNGQSVDNLTYDDLVALLMEE